MIDQLIAALNQEVDLSAEEIADTLWLAMHMEQSEADSISPKSPKSKPDPETTKDQSNQQTEPVLTDKSEIETPTTEQKSTEKEQKSDRTGVYHQQPDQTQKSSDIPFKVPDAPSLREQLDLARALKPLMCRIPSGSTLVLDEAATTQRIADEGIWLPVIKPTLEPWLDLELVVDEGISMQIWRHTIKELERLVKNYGIFRDVRVWGLISNEQNTIQIRRGIGATAKNQSLRSAAELIDSSGRRLVLVVSDCVSDLWRSGAVNLALQTWANNVPTAIIQMLPQWLWGRTALGRATEVRFQGLTPSVSNRQLIANTVSLWSEIDEARGIKVPVFTLEPERVSKWAQMLVGKGSIQSSGFVFKPEIRNLEQEKPLFNLNRGELTPQQRVQAFRVTASPMARKLAGLLASAPVISLPVVRLIRETMLKESQQVHVAEVFLGGLLKPLSKIEVDTEPDYVQYGFIDGVRQLLVDSIPTSSVLQVVEEVSKFVAKKVGLSLSEFAAILKNPEQISDTNLVEKVHLFAMVTAQILKRLGSEYEKIADELLTNHDFQVFERNSTLTRLIKHAQSQSNLKQKEIIIERIATVIMSFRPLCHSFNSQPLTGVYRDLYLQVKESLITHLREHLLPFKIQITKQNPDQITELQPAYLYDFIKYIFQQILDDNQLKKMALYAQKYPVNSKFRNYALTELTKAIKLSGKLHYPHTKKFSSTLYQSLHEEVLAETLANICLNIDLYDSDKEDVQFMNWVNFELEQLMLKKYVESQKYALQSASNELIYALNSEQIQDNATTRYQSQILQDYLEQDPEKVFSMAHIKNRPDANYRNICIARFEGQTWEKISKNLDIPITTLSSFYNRWSRRFSPFLRTKIEKHF